MTQFDRADYNPILAPRVQLCVIPLVKTNAKMSPSTIGTVVPYITGQEHGVRALEQSNDGRSCANGEKTYLSR